jgi:CBS domain-containing membrane protein
MHRGAVPALPRSSRISSTRGSASPRACDRLFAPAARASRTARPLLLVQSEQENRGLYEHRQGPTAVPKPKANGMKKQLVADVMTHEVSTVDPNDQLAVADDVMRLARFRHMPVVDDGNLVGIVSSRDLFHNALLKALGYGTHAKHKAMETIRVKEVMTFPVVTTTPAARLSDAAKTMRDKKLGCLVVVEGERIVGILTEGDFVALAAAEA